MRSQLNRTTGRNNKSLINRIYFLIMCFAIIPHLIISVITGVVISTFVLTLGMYMFGFFIFFILFNKGIINVNVFTAICISFLLLFSGEIYFRYFNKKYKNYTEKFDTPIYYSMYRWHNWFVLNWMYRLDEPQGDVFTYNAPEFKYDHNYNNLGFRGIDIHDKRNDEYRIVALGDSFTEGVGTPDDSTWCVLLENKIKKSISNNISLLNLGKTGSDPVYRLHLLQERWDILQPDMVILAVNNTDIYDMLTRGGKSRYDDKGRLTLKLGPWWEGFYAYSFIVRHLIHDVFSYDRYLVHKDDKANILLNACKDLTESISEIDQYCSTKNIDFYVYYIPHEFEFNIDKLYRYHENDIELAKKHIKDNGINMIDLTPIMYNKYIKKDVKYYWQIDSHCNSKGYDMISTLIFLDIYSKQLQQYISN